MIDLQNKTARVFCSYSHRDDEFRRELEAHLGALTRQNLITFWYDRRIVPGDEWRTEIATELTESDIILLLISAYFISSDYCYQIELGEALQRHKDGSAIVIPIFVRPCDWEGLAFSDLQGLPVDGVAVSEHKDREKPWSLVAKGIREARSKLITQALPRVTLRRIVSVDERETYEAVSYFRHLMAFRKEMLGTKTLSFNVEVNGETKSLKAVLETWAKGNVRPLFLLVGDPGSGKTWALRQLAATLAEGIVEGDKMTPQPLYIPFQALAGGDGDIDALHKAVPEARSVLEKLNEGKNTVLLLDGIDEVSLESADAGVRVLLEILREMPSNTGVAVTSRSRLASELLDRVETLGHNVVVCTIPPVDRTLLEEDFSSLGSSINPTTDIRDAAMARWMSQEILNLRTGRPQNMKGLYEQYVSVSINLARERDSRVAAMPAEVLLSFITSLSGLMFPLASTNINTIQMKNISNARKLDIINALVASRLLTISSREMISFVHVSFFEFFFAKLLFEELLSWRAEHLSRSNLIYSYNINRFLIPLLLEAQPSSLTPQAHRTREQLLQNTLDMGNSVITQPILTKYFREFVDDTGWRRDTGFGQWVSFTDPSGNLTASDGTIVPERQHLSLFGPSRDPNAVAVSLSWYDAYQFARWIGGSVPTYLDLSSVNSSHSPAFEWTSSWFSEVESLVSVRRSIDGNKHGVNPDVRSSKIGFRVQLSRID